MANIVELDSFNNLCLQNCFVPIKEVMGQKRKKPIVWLSYRLKSVISKNVTPTQKLFIRIIVEQEMINHVL